MLSWMCRKENFCTFKQFDTIKIEDILVYNSEILLVGLNFRETHEYVYYVTFPRIFSTVVQKREKLTTTLASINGRMDK